MKEIMIIIDGNIVTKDILICEKDYSRNNYKVKYKKNSYYSYNYSSSRIQVLTKPLLLNLDDISIFYGNEKITDIEVVYDFVNVSGNHFYHIEFKNKAYEDFKGEELKILIDKSQNVFNYMKEVAEVTSLETDDGKKLLSEFLNRVNLNSLSLSLANYLKMSNNNNSGNTLNYLIFPFGCNSSQYKAVERAINNKISVIEGPPGTGKTQTILNIIANILIRGGNCQVVSNNNTAIANIDEKLKKYDLDFFEALLGKKGNKESFIECQKVNIPSFDEYENMDLESLRNEVNCVADITKKIYESNELISKLRHEKEELNLEYKYFMNYVKNNNLNLVDVNINDINHLSEIIDDYNYSNKIGLWKKLKYIFVYKIGNFKFYKNNSCIIVDSISNSYYKFKINELEESIRKYETYVEENKEYENQYKLLSMNYLKKYLSIKYKNKRKKYDYKDIKNDSVNFIKDYPVILSTTYSSKNTFGENFMFDYLIMDESSQVDVVTGTLALSSARNAVIIGDEKQLPNVVTEEIKAKVNNIIYKYNISNGYNYSLNSFLSSIKNIISDVPVTLLREHYRCHPKIINFCNKKFYNGDLIVMTEDKGEKNVIKVIRTNKGNHSRNKHNQRQIDIIKDILPKIESEDIGVIAPYNDQVSTIKSNIPDLDVSTVHKFQGREKDAIIISTVDDEISDFVANANIMNVAISRVKKQLFLIVTGNEIKNKNISDFIDYVAYNNMEIEDSKIYSIFDLLYKQYNDERIEYFKHHNKISGYDSENLMFDLINRLVKDYKGLSFSFRYPMRLFVKDKSILTERECQYANHHATHIDFLLYNELGCKPILAIEVDSPKFHAQDTKQYERDLLKDEIFRKCEVRLFRAKTDGSNEEEKIRKLLDEIYGISDY